jgi:stage II sporulation protein D
MKGTSKIWPPKIQLLLHKWRPQLRSAEEPVTHNHAAAPLSALSSLPGMAGLRKVRLAGGIVFAGLVLTQVPPSPLSLMGQSDASPEPVEAALWQSTGTVRQSIVELYRARRLLIQSATVAESAASPQADATPEALSPGQASPNQAGTNSSASQAETSTTTPSSSGQPASTAQSAGKALPRPSAPPNPAAQTQAPFDPSKTIDTNMEMRVAVAKNVSSLAVATSVDGFLMDLNGENHCNLPAQQSFALQPQGGGMGFGSCRLSNTVWLEPGEGGYVYVGDKWFKGRVLLLQEGGRLTAVNFVLMHDYLSSVVGSEMYVHWPLEALKAQAVAARSYALTHHVRHANRAYDLDNTQRYQAYLGIAKETNTTQAAVAATTGEFISYNNGIVESLYAASDEIVRAAHGGNGMSQTGAMELASMGYSYAEILGNYYPGTALSRLVVK